jgi:ubiquinone/menaquinone biosynthesis C-methylase UbiE
MVPYYIRGSTTGGFMEPYQPSFLRIIGEEIIDYRIRSRYYHPKYVRTLDLVGSERVLEFGCGGGCMSRALSRVLQPDGRLTCVDISEYWIKKSQRRLHSFKNIEFLVGDITRLEMPDNSYDAVVIHFALHEVDPTVRIDVVNALAKTLHAEGTVFIREPAHPTHGIPLAEIQALMRDAGLREHHAGCARSWRWGMICDGVFLKSW